MPGRHNALNAAAALAVGARARLARRAACARGWPSFTGTRRRFELKGDRRGVRVFDDYAHHPTELAADLRGRPRGRRRAAGSSSSSSRTCYSRTAAFAAEFGDALGLADEVVVMDVYAAREDPIPGVTGALGRRPPCRCPPDQVVFEPSWSAVAGQLAGRARPGDVVLTCGAGDVTMIGPEVLARLQARDRGVSVTTDARRPARRPRAGPAPRPADGRRWRSPSVLGLVGRRPAGCCSAPAVLGVRDGRR